MRALIQKSLLASLCQREVVSPSFAKRGEGRFENCHFSYGFVICVFRALNSADYTLFQDRSVLGRKAVKRPGKCVQLLVV